MFFAQLVAWTYNALLLGLDILAATAIFGRRTRRHSAIVVVLHLIIAIVVATVLTRATFLWMRLLAYALFLHLPLVLLVAAILLWRHRPHTSLLLTTCVGVIVAVGCDAFLIEPHWLTETYVTLPSNKIRTPIRIAILADIQTDHFGTYERQALVTCLAAKPDLILLAGDYIQVANAQDWHRVRDAMNACLRELDPQATWGVFAVEGNTDRPSWGDIFTGTSIQRFGQTQSIDLGPLVITGLSIRDSFDRRLTVAPADAFHVVFGHAPDFALGDVNADLLIAGHTHGGQVCLPGIGPLVTASQIPRAWASGKTRLTGNRWLVISRGIGMERLAAPRLRFLCRPELVFIDLVPIDASQR